MVGKMVLLLELILVVSKEMKMAVYLERGTESELVG